MVTSRCAPIGLLTGLLAGLFVAVTTGEPASAGRQRDRSPASIKQWSAEVVVTSDCDHMAIDGSRTVIHNRIATIYEFTRRIIGAPELRWAGRAMTTYRWAVGTEFRGSRDIEESAGSFDSDAELNLTVSTKISIGRPPGRPFTRKKYAGDLLLELSTADDIPPAAELYDAALPSDTGTLSGDRMESAYSMLGGMLLNCPARRQWTLRAP